MAESPPAEAMSDKDARFLQGLKGLMAELDSAQAASAKADSRDEETKAEQVDQKAPPPTGEGEDK